MNLDAPILQVEFADLVGVSEAAVSQWLSEGVLERGGSARQWLQAYCARLREQAAGRDPTGELTSERARVARETADKIAMENAVRRREHAPVGLLEVVLSHIARQIATRLDALVPQIKRRIPSIDPAALAMIEADLATCRELCASVNLADAERLEREEEAMEDVT